MPPIKRTLETQESTKKFTKTHKPNEPKSIKTKNLKSNSQNSIFKDPLRERECTIESQVGEGCVFSCGGRTGSLRWGLGDPWRHFSVETSLFSSTTCRILRRAQSPSDAALGTRNTPSHLSLLRSLSLSNFSELDNHHCLTNRLRYNIILERESESLFSFREREVIFFFWSDSL